MKTQVNILRSNANQVLTFENIPEMIGIPFILMTPRTQQTNFKKDLNLEVYDFLHKPANNDLRKNVCARLSSNELTKKAFTNNTDGLNFFVNLAKIQGNDRVLTDRQTFKKLKKKNILFSEGECSYFLYFIVSGKIKVFKSSECGKEYVIDIYKEGEFLGYHTLLENNINCESAIAIENSEIALIPRTDFLKVLHSNFEIGLKFFKLISRKFTELEERQVKLAYNSARKRMAEAILFIYRKLQNESFFNLDRDTMSGIAGISNESVSRILNAFKEEGIIENFSGKIKIIDLKKLESLRN